MTSSPAAKQSLRTRALFKEHQMALLTASATKSQLGVIRCLDATTEYTCRHLKINMDEAELCLQQHRSEAWDSWVVLVSSTAVSLLLSGAGKVAYPVTRTLQFAVTITTLHVAHGRHNKDLLHSAMTMTTVSVAPGGHDRDSLPSSLCCRR